ncbi:MAG: helix-turn-helix transcriptional regulator [Alphaproteobacteria bacterium]|nr:helix-turn-helix transcriptional regulator [Alphaproteobacteria bacterium]
MPTPIPAASAGTQLRGWRLRRRLSQLNLALDAEISARHLSFLETGRAQPSREMVLRLAAALEMPLRARNDLLVAAGFAPVFRERPLADASMTAARRAVERILVGHLPFPALAVDRHWNLVLANDAVTPLLAGIDADMLAPPINVLRLSLHPRGLAPRIVNIADWRAHILARLHRQAELSGDPVLGSLLDELRGYPVAVAEATPETADDLAGIAMPLRLRVPGGVLSFVGTTTVFGTPVDLTLAELALETFFPADEATARALGVGARS